MTAPCRVRPAERLLWVRLPSEGLDASWCHRLDIAIVWLKKLLGPWVPSCCTASNETFFSHSFSLKPGTCAIRRPDRAGSSYDNGLSPLWLNWAGAWCGEATLLNICLNLSRTKLLDRSVSWQSFPYKKNGQDHCQNRFGGCSDKRMPIHWSMCNAPRNAARNSCNHLKSSSIPIRLTYFRSLATPGGGCEDDEGSVGTADSGNMWQ